ncbi:MAG: NADP-dependent oxidoreductase [Ilumatobacteraceae bacterium]
MSGQFRDVREVRLARIPDGGTVRAEDFAVVDVTSPPTVGSGNVLIGLRRLGLNAGLATRLGGPGSAYGPGIAIGDVPASDAVVEVLDGGNSSWRAGELALCQRAPWRTVSAVESTTLQRLPADRGDLVLESYLTILGHVGFTAWVGMVHVGQVRPTDIVYVSGAAGGVGSCAVQFAKACGAKVVGSAGSADKVRMLTEELGADAAFNHRDGPVLDSLTAVAPQGIDLFYDNIGGAELVAALERLRFQGRVVICGAASRYGKPPDHPGPANYTRLISQELTMQGFTVTAHEDLRPTFEAAVGALLRDGTVRPFHTTMHSFERTPEAFAALLSGANSGRMIVAID